MAEDKRGLLTLGAFFISVVVGILLYAAKLIDWTLIVPVVLVVFGIWMLALAGMRSSSPTKYGPSGFATMSIGLVLIAVGGAWYLFTVNWLYSIVLLLLVFAALAVAAAMKRK
ncbi:MAG: hypothetical protein ACE14S_09410 [Candidatus Bathyarchaeia archaeon]